MPDTFTDTLRAVALNIGVPALIVFWYACRVRHPARPRWQAFLMALAVLATVPAATLAGLHYAITVRDGSPLILIPSGSRCPSCFAPSCGLGFAARRAHGRPLPRQRARPRSIRSQPGRRNRRPLTAIRPQRAGGVTRMAAAEQRTAQPLTRPERGGIRGCFMGGCLYCPPFFAKYLANSSISALYLQYRPHFKAWYPCFYRQARAEYSQATGLYVLARQVTDAPLDLVAHRPASLTIHGVVFPCRARSAGDGPAGGSAPVDAPARSAPELVHPSRTCPGPLAARPTDSPRVVRLLVSLRGENTQHRQPGRRQTDAPHHQEERARVATTLASR